VARRELLEPYRLLGGVRCFGLGPGWGSSWGSSWVGARAGAGAGAGAGASVVWTASGFVSRRSYGSVRLAGGPPQGASSAATGRNTAAPSPHRSNPGQTQEPPAVKLNDALGGLLTWKLAGEDAVRGSGVPAVVVRPCALTEEPRGMPLQIDQGDTIKVGPPGPTARLCLVMWFAASCSVPPPSLACALCRLKCMGEHQPRVHPPAKSRHQSGGQRNASN
jgi:hypothetical protein